MKKRTQIEAEKPNNIPFFFSNKHFCKFPFGKRGKLAEDERYLLWIAKLREKKRKRSSILIPGLSNFNGMGHSAGE